MNQASLLSRPRVSAPAFYNLMDSRPTDFTSEIVAGLQADQKRIDPKFFYDERGSGLFEMITMTDEYYVTRAETEILALYANEIAELTGTGHALIEPGCGSCTKVEYLLPAMQPGLYLPTDISEVPLREAQQRLARRFPDLPCLAVCVDFDQIMDIATMLPALRRTLFYPGSTLGNFAPDSAVAFLRVLRELIGSDGGLLVGVDLDKDPQVLEAAYNDTLGVTAAFNLNVLNHINRLTGAGFVMGNFEHLALYNPAEHRIEMHLRSRRRQQLRINGASIDIAAGETIHTENSYKYSLESLSALMAQAGFVRVQTWTDSRNLFGLHYFGVVHPAAL